MTDPEDLGAVPTVAEFEDPDWVLRRRTAQRAWVETRLAATDDPKQIESLRAWLAQMDYTDKNPDENPSATIARTTASARERGDVLFMAYGDACQACLSDPDNPAKAARLDRLMEAVRIVIAANHQTIRELEEENARLRDDEGAA